MKGTVNLMLGSNPKDKREENDFYATHPHAVEIALPTFEKIGLGGKKKEVWECACGQGHISKTLERNGYKVFSTDLIDRGYGQVQDFLKFKSFVDCDIISNPPFALAEDFVEHAMRIVRDGIKVVFLLKIQFLEGKRRKKLFEKYPPKYVIVNSETQHCCKNAEFDKLTATTQCYAWYVWEKGFNGRPEIMWI